MHDIVIINVEKLFLTIMSIANIDLVTRYITAEKIITAFLQSDHDCDPIQLLYEQLEKANENYEFSDYMIVFTDIAIALETELMDLYPKRQNGITTYSYQMCEYRFFQWTGRYTVALKRIDNE